jgi:hypothetical protein
MKKTPAHGGHRTGAGRPAVKPGEETVTFTFRLSTTQRAKLDALGSGEWIRARIDKARKP